MGANELVLPADGLGTSVDEDMAATFNILMNERFGAADLIELTIVERKIMSLEYLIAKCQNYTPDNPEAPPTEADKNQTALGLFCYYALYFT